MKNLNPLPFLFYLTLSFFLAGCNNSNEPISLESLLEEMIDRYSITQFPDPAYSLEQFSSYDRRSTGPDEKGWYANEDYTMFLGVDSLDGRREFVLLDNYGPGAIVRWWMTFAGEGSYEGTIRVYLDGSEKPVIEDKVLKVISGQLLAGEPLSASVSPESDYHQRGHNLYLPIPYARSCKITYECDSIKVEGKRWTPSIYYNINYRAYQEGTEIKSFSLSDLEKAGILIKEVNRVLNSGNKELPSYIESEDTLLPGTSFSASIDEANSAITGLSLIIEAEDLNQALRSTVLEISFDNLTTVWVPAGDFFGTGFNLKESSTWYSSVSKDTLMTCKWIMPFKRVALVRIFNFGNQNIKCSLSVNIADHDWNDKTMYFGSAWHEYNRIRTAGDSRVGGNDKHIDINYIDIEGMGVYAGDAITIFNTVDAWWGEGDEKIYVDGEIFPSSIGTGTEDYYGYAWCRPEPFSHPFIAQPTGEGNFNPGMTVNMRYRNLDAIPFTSKLSSNIELWHWVPAIMNYALTSYFYVLPGYHINIKADPEAVMLKVPVNKNDLFE